MSRLLDTVGLGGRNRPGDVRLVQTLLNRHRLPGVGRLATDGKMGPKTLKAINTFQQGPGGLRRPDGLVEPGRSTYRKLQQPAKPAPPRSESQAGGGTARSSPASSSRSPTSPTSPTSATTTAARRSARPKGFVSGGVKENALTTRIIDGIAPTFRGERARVISGYMNDEALFWKVNYHWDYLLWMVEHSVGLDVSDTSRRELTTIRSNLKAHAPNPSTGYRTSPVGKPKDTSTMDQMTKRHRVVAQSKRALKVIIQRERLPAKSKRTTKAFDYAVAPVAHPGTSKHGSGYALDIEGDNKRIGDLCSQLGASVVFDEKSHVHVEFKNGVARRG